MFVPVPEIRTATRAFVMTLSPQSVRAELVEALFCLSTSKEKERPFDKLRANGERGQPWYVALHAAIALHVSDPPATVQPLAPLAIRSEEPTSELQSLMRTSYAVFCLKKKNTNTQQAHDIPSQLTAVRHSV